MQWAYRNNPLTALPYKKDTLHTCLKALVTLSKADVMAQALDGESVQEGHISHLLEDVEVVNATEISEEDSVGVPVQEGHSAYLLEGAVTLSKADVMAQALDGVSIQKGHTAYLLDGDDTAGDTAADLMGVPLTSPGASVESIPIQKGSN